MFSLNLAWIILWVERVKSKGLSGLFADKIMAWASGAYQLASPIGGGTVLDQLVWSLSSAL